jgi:hypothetical protein
MVLSGGTSALSNLGTPVRCNGKHCQIKLKYADPISYLKKSAPPTQSLVTFSGSELRNRRIRPTITMLETEPDLGPILEQLSVSEHDRVREISVGLGSGHWTDPTESQPW